MRIRVGEHVGDVAAILLDPPGAQSLYVFAHGCGAGLRHAFMETLAQALAEHGVATLRYNFPYLEAGKGRPDPPAVLEATVRAAIDAATPIAKGRTVIAGGKSMGGRMTSQLLAKRSDLPVKGLACVGFPLHQPGKPALSRAAHLHDVRVPMLFMQGTRDTLADLALMQEVCAALGDIATLHIVAGADHSFHVLKRSGRSGAEVFEELANTLADWAASLSK